MGEAGDIYNRLLGYFPVRHQQEAWDLLSQGKSIIIRAPTGSGKTEAVVLPYLKYGGINLPGRLIYALPLRSLAKQVSDRLRVYAEKIGKPPNWRVRLQHGEAPESVLFTADSVVATIDQVITSYACTPLTLPVRHGNIPAGAVMSSFLVFDEVHLFDPELGLQATQFVCHRLYRLGMPYALLSATLPDSVVEFWQKRLGAEVIESDGELVQRQVTVKWVDSVLNADEVRRALGQVHRILVVCNTVERAIELYRQVSKHAQDYGYECNLIHSRFLPEHRQQKEDWVIRNFGKNTPRNAKAFLIATQVVEAGLDISADLLLTEVAPVDALIQRAGRVARWGGNGEVWIYDVESAAPYEQHLVNKTKEVLRRNCEAILGWTTVKCWVNQILNEAYCKILYDNKAYEQVVYQLSQAAFEGSRSRAEAAVRDVNTVEVSLHSSPCSLKRCVLRLPTIGVHIGIARKWAKQAAQAKAQVWRLEVDRNPSDALVNVELKPITDRDISLGDRLIFPCSVLVYSDQLGLREKEKEGVGGPDFQPQSGHGSPLLLSNLQRETWIDHSVRVTQALDGVVLQKERHAVSALASLLRVSDDEVRKAAKLAALLHDLGKLNLEWQRKADISKAADPADLLAHTDKRDYGSFPPHATVSAYALWPALVDGGALEERRLAKAVCFAIAHHHSVRAKEVPRYELHPKWQSAVQQALRQCGLDGALNLDRILTSQESSTDLRTKIPPMEDDLLYTAYVLLSRWLRLADRMATGGENGLLHYENWFGRL